MDSQQVRIERLVAGGDALGRLSDGRVVFVPGALPDEVVDIEITHTKTDFARGKLLQVVTESPHRIAPPCEHVARGCGGCSWQHLASAAQVSAKVEIVREALRRNGKITDIEVVSGGRVADRGARTTLRMAVDSTGRLGFRRGSSHEVVDTPVCMVAHPLLNELIHSIRARDADEVTLRCGAMTRERSAWVHDEDGRGTLSGLPHDVGIGHEAIIHEVVSGVKLQVSMSSFFQASLEGAEMLVNTVRDAAGEHALSGIDGPVIDAYGGVGLFSATLVSRSTPIVLIESNTSACADARENLAGYTATVVRGSVERWRAEPAGVVIADPARSGLGAAGVARLVQTRAPRIVLVSCDAVAGARDTRLLRDAGYACSQATVLDLFPHTPHVEVVSTFTR
ncbi:MAG: class I SAM-dependent RNA methyltransferase [Ilumatobacteraceae bacterium]